MATENQSGHNVNSKTQDELAEELERIESTRANERKVAGKGIDHKDGRPEGQARDIVASNFNISGRQYDNRIGERHNVTGKTQAVNQKSDERQQQNR